MVAIVYKGITKNELSTQIITTHAKWTNGKQHFNGEILLPTANWTLQILNFKESKGK